jgi:hypothetical protein
MELSRTYRRRIAAAEEKYALAHNTLGKELFQKAAEWFFTANNEIVYIRSRISVNIH